MELVSCSFCFARLNVSGASLCEANTCEPVLNADRWMKHFFFNSQVNFASYEVKILVAASVKDEVVG